MRRGGGEESALSIQRVWKERRGIFPSDTPTLDTCERGNVERERGGGGGKVKGRGRRVKVASWKTPVSFLHGFSSSKQRDAANRFPPALLISIPVSCDYFPFLFYKYYVFLITAACNKFSSSRGFE